jgi:hypothetical protein
VIAYNRGKFKIHWKPGKVNLADYYTKHHSATNHQQVQPLYLHMQDKTSPITNPIVSALQVLQGCAKPTPLHSTVPRVQGIQNNRTNTPAEPYTNMLAQLAASAHQQCNGGQAARQ